MARGWSQPVPADDASRGWRRARGSLGFVADLEPIGGGQWAFAESGFGTVIFFRNGSGTSHATARSVDLNNFSGFEGTFSCNFDNNGVNCEFPVKDGTVMLGTGMLSAQGSTIQVVEHVRPSAIPRRRACRR